MTRATLPGMVILALGSPLAAGAADGPWNTAFTIQVGAFNADAHTTARLDATTINRGTEVSLEGDLGVQKTKTLPDIYGLWRFNDRHAIEAEWVSLRRDGTRSITGQISWGDATFPINSTVNTTFDSDVVRVAYRYSAINNDGNELAFLAGLHYTTLKTSLSNGAGTASDSASVDVPLPTIGIRASARFADHWRVTGFGQFLKLKIGDYDGELLNGTAAVEWAFLPNAYAGLGYNYYNYKLTSEKTNARGKFEFRFDGPTLYAAWAFR